MHKWIHIGKNSAKDGFRISKNENKKIFLLKAVLLENSIMLLWSDDFVTTKKEREVGQPLTSLRKCSIFPSYKPLKFQHVLQDALEFSI